MGRGKQKKKHRSHRAYGISEEGVKRRLEAIGATPSTEGAGLTGRKAAQERLKDPDARVREEACLDVAQQVLDPAQLNALREARTHCQLTYLVDDQNMDVRRSAATAIRNFCSVGRDDVIDEVVAENGFLERFGKAMLAQFGIAVNADGEAPLQDAEGQDCLPVAALDEMVQLSSVLIEGSEVAAGCFASESDYLNLLVDCLAHPGSLQVSAAEALHIVSDDNAPVGEFMASQLSPEGQERLNGFTTNVPHSPQLMRVAVHLCAALLNVSPDPDSISRTLPVITAAMEVNPMQEVRKLLPLLSADCDLDEKVRQAGVTQGLDRLRSLQSALDVFGNVVSIVCEANPDDDDDEQAFAANEHAGLIMESGAMSSIANNIGAILSPLDDAVFHDALRSPCDSNPEVTSMQQLYLSSEVAIIGIASSLLHLLPLSTFGDADGMWNVCMGALRERMDLYGEVPTHDELLVLQIESLAEMSWTIQRKDYDGETSPQPGDLDVFTRIAWERDASTETKVFVINAVSCIGIRVATPEIAHVCGKFFLGMLEQNDLEVQGEAANVIMDVFGDENFDADVYVPLGFQGTLSDFLPYIKQEMAKMPKRSQRRMHLDEIATNLGEFIKYKKKNIRSL